MVKLTIQTIKIYQTINKLWISSGAGHSLVSPGCNFYPCCSEYAVESLKKYGFRKGLACSVARIFKCHPWAHPRVDFP